MEKVTTIRIKVESGKMRSLYRFTMNMLSDAVYDMEQDRYVCGEFVWTGIDYLGEPTPFAKDSRSSYFGIVDLTGVPKDRYYLYRSLWNRKSETVHLLPHWNWKPGDRVPVSRGVMDRLQALILQGGLAAGDRVIIGGYEQMGDAEVIEW